MPFRLPEVNGDRRHCRIHELSASARASAWASVNRADDGLGRGSARHPGLLETREHVALFFPERLSRSRPPRRAARSWDRWIPVSSGPQGRRPRNLVQELVVRGQFRGGRSRPPQPEGPSRSSMRAPPRSWSSSGVRYRTGPHPPDGTTLRCGHARSGHGYACFHRTTPRSWCSRWSRHAARIEGPRRRCERGDLNGGSDGRRSRDLTIFSRALYQLSYRASRSGLPDVRKAPSKRGSVSATLTGLEPATSAVTGRRANQLRYRAKLFNCVCRDPNGIRTRAAAVKGRCPRPLNDGAASRKALDYRRTSIGARSANRQTVVFEGVLEWLMLLV